MTHHAILDNLPLAVKELRYHLPEALRHGLSIWHRRSYWAKAGIIFIHIPKAAGTSINEALYGRSLGHFAASEMQRFAPALFANLPSFAVTRNPWDRLVSAYRFAKKGSGGHAAIRYPKRYSVSAFATFERFIEEWLPQQDLDQVDYVFRSQGCFVTDKRRKVVVDFLGRVEEMGAVKEYLESHLGRSVVIGHLNVTSTTREYRASYTKKLARMVGDLYACDVGLFNYDF